MYSKIQHIELFRIFLYFERWIFFLFHPSLEGDAWLFLVPYLRHRDMH